MAKVSAATPAVTGFTTPAVTPVVNVPAIAPPIAAVISAATGSAKAKKSPLSIPGGLMTVGLLLFNGSLKISSLVFGSTLTL